MEKSAQQFTARETFQAGLSDLNGNGELGTVLAPRKVTSEAR